MEDLLCKSEVFDDESADARRVEIVGTKRIVAINRAVIFLALHYLVCKTNNWCAN